MSVEDLAQVVEAQEWARNNRVRPPAPVYAPGDAQYGPAECAECEIDMPELRRAMGRCMCVDCTDRDALRKKIRGA